jgi:NTE family protein
MLPVDLEAERSDPLTAVVLPGGAARGAYQVGALQAIADIVPGNSNPFPIIMGASVGAINAAFLAGHARRFGTGVAQLARFWREIHTSSVYSTDFIRIALSGLHWVTAMTPLANLGISHPHYLLDNQPLTRLLSDAIDFAGIDGAIRAKALHAVGVTASSYSGSRATTFFQGAPSIEPWQRVRREGVPARLGVSHLMASVALPLIFEAQRIGPEYYGDGSVRLVSPLSPAIHAGAERILVIGTRDREPGPASVTEDVAYPSPGLILGYLLDTVFMDNVDADVERAQRVNQTLSLIAPAERTRTPLKPVSILTLMPSRDVREIAGRHASEMPWTIRMLLRRLGMWGDDWRLVSYLLFETGYCCALMDLGYRDAFARREEILAFLGNGRGPGQQGSADGVPAARLVASDAPSNTAQSRAITSPG